MYEVKQKAVRSNLMWANGEGAETCAGESALQGAFIQHHYHISISIRVCHSARVASRAVDSLGWRKAK